MENKNKFCALREVVRRLMNTIPQGELRKMSAVQALDRAINCGGGQSFNPRIGEFWMFDYYPGIRISLYAETKIEIERNIILIVAEEYLHQQKSRQLSLF